MDVLIERIYEQNRAQISDKIKIEHFALLSMIGKGSYADVILARKKDTGTIYALKMLKKSKIEQKNQKTHVNIERNILIEVQHPFLIRMMYTFQSDKMLYFALEYCPGGELFNLLQKKRQFSEDCARFYIVQILLALEYLHQFDIAYRDLKPENVLIDKDGYIRLTDFGLSKKGIKGNRETNSVCGTPEYLAPEVLFQGGHGKAVDWWTLGAILFEMLTGLPPFYTPNREDLFKKIKFYTLRYPDFLSDNAKNLLEGLFQKDPEKRLGGGPRDADEIKTHPWFAEVDWNAYMRKEIRAPFIPIVKDDMDVSNFDAEFTEAPIGSLGDSGPGQTYPGWSYTGSESLKMNSGINHEENSYHEGQAFEIAGLDRDGEDSSEDGTKSNKMETE